LRGNVIEAVVGVTGEDAVAALRVLGASFALGRLMVPGVSPLRGAGLLRYASLLVKTVLASSAGWTYSYPSKEA
jgi:hypothetical protein